MTGNQLKNAIVHAEVAAKTFLRAGDFEAGCYWLRETSTLKHRLDRLKSRIRHSRAGMGRSATSTSPGAYEAITAEVEREIARAEREATKLVERAVRKATAKISAKI